MIIKGKGGNNGGSSKMDKCKVIYKEMMEDDKNSYSRKDVLKRFMDEVKMSEEGGKSYYFNISKLYKEGKL